MFRFLICVLLPLLLAPASMHALARTMETVDVSVVHKATPAVVNIAIWKVRPPANPGDTPRRVKAYGSGFIIDPSGIIVTNKHVIDGALDIKVLLSDGSIVAGRLLAAAAMLDVAVVKVDVDHPLPVLKWADSRALEVGDSVLAMGNPLGLGLSVSAGIVSALNRDIQDTPFDQYIQTDAAINHGNSGGPLVNREGAVVGVDTALYNPDEAGGFIGIGFAIPSESARFVVTRLLDPNHPKPGWLGFTLQDLTQELAEALGMRGMKGSIISALDTDGPATKAGLRLGDVITAINGVSSSDSRAYMRAIVGLPVGQQADLTIWRDSKKQAVKATIAEWPNSMPGGGVMNARTAEMMIQKMPDPGVRLAPLTDDARKEYGIDAKTTGALIASVETDCEASDLGILPGDVITAVQGAPVSSPDEVRRAIQKAHEQRRTFLAVLVQGKSNARWVSISISAPGS